eukprot:9459156-Alexandrium_andersonii.AAC.1
MSASLVGSEMCIRDSLRPCQALVRAFRRLSALSGIFLLPTSAWKCPEPVSYTHLTLPTICSV